MTTLEAPPRNGRVPIEVAEPPADPVGGPANSPRRADAPAARGPAILRLTRGAAVVITVVIALSSFVL